MGIGSIPLIIPGKFVDGVYVNANTVIPPITDTTECLLVKALVFQSPLAFALTGAFASGSSCVGAILALDD